MRVLASADPRTLPWPTPSHLPGVDALTAVYVANVLAHEHAAAHDHTQESFAPMDVGYLEALGVSDRLPAWREIAATQILAAQSAYWETDMDRKAA